MKQMSLQSS